MKTINASAMFKAREAVDKAERHYESEKNRYSAWLANTAKYDQKPCEETIRCKAMEKIAARNAIDTAKEAFRESTEKLSQEIEKAQHRCTARTISAAGIIDKLIDVEEKLGISKKAMNGITVRCDLNAQSFPNAYRYTPESTYFCAEYKNGSWRITDVFRGTTAGPKSGTQINLTDDAKKAILDSIACY